MVKKDYFCFDFRNNCNKIKNKILPRSKCSQGHVEIILSAVLFIGFLIFIFALFNPVIKTKKNSEINDFQKKIIDRISSDIGKLSVVVDTENDCYSLDEVKDEYLQQVNGEYVNNFIEIQESSDQNGRTYTIYFGDFFDPKGRITCEDRTGRNFRLGNYIEDRIIVHEKIVNLKKDYEDNTLQQLFEKKDFSFIVKDLDGNVLEELSASEKIPQNIDVISKDIPIRVMNKQGIISELVLNIKAWS